MATRSPTATQQLERFNRWMKRTFPGFAFTQTQAQQLLRDYRMGRASLPPELTAALSGKVLPVKLPRKVLPAKLPAKKRAAPRPTPKAPRPIIIRPEYHPPARASRHARIEDEDDFGDRDDAQYEIDEEDFDEERYVTTRPVGGELPWFDGDDYGELEVDISESDS